MILARIIYTGYLFLLTGLSFVLGTLATIVVAVFAGNKHRPFQLAARLWARFLIFFSGVRVSVTGLNNIPKNTPLLIAANHQGALDILIVLACLPIFFRFAIKKELFRVPVFGWYLKQAGYFPIDRELILSAYKIVDVIKEIFATGDSVLIFPEGTRSVTGQLGKFKRGSLVTALKTGCPVLPIAISGSYDLMPRNSRLITPGRVKLTVCPLVYIKTEEEYNLKVNLIRSEIEKNL